MKTAHLASAVTPIRIESADLLRLRGHERQPMLTLAALSRGLSVIALCGCAFVALALRGPGPAPKEAASPAVATPPGAAAPRPAPVATQEAAAEVRLVYGNPDAPRIAARQPDPAPMEPPPAPIVVTPATPSPAVAAPVDEAPKPMAFAAAEPTGAVDLNSATVEQLNGLNAGMIGRAIVKGRPYSAPEDLLGRRILSRASFEKIKGRVAVATPLN